MLIVLILEIAGLSSDFYRSRHGDKSTEALILIAFALSEIAVGLLVLDQTYRKTILQVRDGEMTLTFSALLSRTRRHRWPIGEIGVLNVHSTQSGMGLAPLAELRLQPARDVSVHLFSDHRQQDVQHIADLVRAALLGQTMPAIPQPAVAHPDEETFDRLIQTHRTLRVHDRGRQIDRGAGDSIPHQ